MARMWLRPADTPAWESEIPSQVRAQTGEFGTERLNVGSTSFGTVSVIFLASEWVGKRTGATVRCARDWNFGTVFGRCAHAAKDAAVTWKFWKVWHLNFGNVSTGVPQVFEKKGWNGACEPATRQG